MAKYIVMVGNLSEGYMPIGPFDDWDEAAAAFDGAYSWMMTIHTHSEYLHYMRTGKWINEETGLEEDSD